MIAFQSLVAAFSYALVSLLKRGELLLGNAHVVVVVHTRIRVRGRRGDQTAQS